MALLKNPLHDYASHNYVWALSAMYPGEVNRPEEYEDSIGKILVVKGGGVGTAKTTTTEAERNANSNGEFFIDDVEIITTVTPSDEAASTTNAGYTFKVTEPYSLGLFLQTMALAAREAGFLNWIHAPFLLSLQFKGWKHDGTYEETKLKQFVISISAVQFSATAAGAVYDVTAVPYSYKGLQYAYQGLKTDISLRGSTVGEILNFGEDSLTTHLNKRGLLEGSENFKSVGDQYQITFPFDISPDVPDRGPFSGPLQSIQTGLDRVNNTIEAIGGLGNSIGNIGKVLNNISQEGFGDGFNEDNDNETVSGTFNTTLNTIGDALNSLAAAISQDGLTQITNEIGSSRMVDDFNDPGLNPFEFESDMYNGTKEIFDRITLGGRPDTEREYKFSQGTTIEQIVESIVLTSKWGQEFINRPWDRTGRKPWFRIKTKVYILSLAEEVSGAGRPAYRFVYEVYPYYIHKSTVSLPYKSQNYDLLIDDSAKAYDYMYTGLNRDIIDFDIHFNSAFYIGVSADNQQASVAGQTTRNGVAVAETSDPPVSTPKNTEQKFNQTLGDIQSTLEEVSNLYRSVGGSFIDTDRTRVAQMYRTLILNNQSDMTALDLTIWGDPYYINTSDAGNRVSAPLYPHVDSAYEADYLRSEIYVLVRFGTPADYDKNLLQPDPADQFTGVYLLSAVEHNFSKGKFVQKLRLTRRQNQAPSSIDKAKRVVGAFFAGLDAVSQLADVLGGEELSNSIDNFIQEADPAANSLLGLAEIGLNIESIATADYQTIGDKLAGLESLFAQAQRLETQYRETIQKITNIDLDEATINSSIRPSLKPARPTVPTIPIDTPAGPR